MKQDLRKIDTEELTNLLVKWGEKPFKVKQINSWLWQKNVNQISEMTNLSKPLREKLSQNFEIKLISISKQETSLDGTIKFAFQLHDGLLIEGVLIPHLDRLTACVSSQVGCSLSCLFCATGKMKRVRNLDSGEIYDQVTIINNHTLEKYSKPLTNIVYMGMGEPLLNYKEVLKSTHYLTSSRGLNISSKRITLSTAGIEKMIRKLADDQVKFNLALSLHAATDIKRNKIMPINDTNSLLVLSDALNYFYKATNTLITLEYIAFNKFNDTLEDAKHLVSFAKKVPCKVNIIEYNQVEGVSFVQSEEDRLARFSDFLKSSKINVQIRRSRGKDINAACGQLVINKN